MIYLLYATMPKKKKRKKKPRPIQERPLPIKEEGQEYAIVTKMLGNGRVSLKCMDGIDRLGKIRGKMRKRVWIKVEDYLLISLRDFQDEKADIIMKLRENEIRRLQKLKEIPDDNNNNDDCYIIFADEGDGDINLDEI